MQLFRSSMVVGLVAIVGCGPSAATESAGSDTNTTSDSDSETGGADPCLQEPDPGNCEAAFPKWAFDPQSGECYEWIYGGCDGLIPFETLASCQSMCEPCELFSSGKKPTATENPVAIHVRNNTSEGVWLQSFQPHNDSVGFRLQVVQITPEGAQEPFVTAPNECDQLYDTTSTDPDSCPIMYCTDAGPSPGPFYLAPGGIYPTTWDGQYFTQAPLPMRCWPEGCTGEEILAGRWQNVGYETFTASAVVGTVECFNPEDCVCEPNADGWCSPGVLTTLENPTTVTVNGAWPAEGIIELVVN